MKGRPRIKVFCSAHPTVKPLGMLERVGCWLSISLKCRIASLPARKLRWVHHMKCNVGATGCEIVI